ncbi:MAG: hypothetical protein HGB32_06625 [Geobacteraceae bacterium]|nr:hypothetical protein [Geobacteraceae bacterium]NTW79808.1 hypothetical protein [Geobacteraceae bacterium]
MKKLSIIFLMLIAVPALVSADSNIPETKSEPEVVLSDAAKVSSPATLKTEKKIKKKKRASKAKKGHYEDSTINAISMSEEEQQIMQSRNKVDAYRPTKRKPKEQPSKSK